MPTAREHAIWALARIETGGAFASHVHRAASSKQADRRGIELTAGVTRRRRYLDFLIESIYDGSLGKMEPPLKQILRIALYELLYLDTPHRAVVFEAVELAKQILRPGAGRLVNGILRAALRRLDALPEPGKADLADYMATIHSHPTWMVRRYLTRFGPDDTEALLRQNNARPVWGLRCNRLKIAPESLERELHKASVAFERSRYLDDFVRTQRLQAVIRRGLLSNGSCAVQDESTGLVVLLLNPQPGETLIDTCAAPGGKTLYAASLMQNRGRILALDIHAARLDRLSRATSIHGASAIETRVHDLRTFADTVVADRVLVDVPCSGTGVLAKRADLRWRRTVEDLQQLSQLQDVLLDSAARLVRPGGLLVYATCSIEPEENEQRVAAFLARNRTFHLDSPSGKMPTEVLTPEGFLCTLPHVHGVDGAFGVRLRKF